jgi:hypothetical protein
LSKNDLKQWKSKNPRLYLEGWRREKFDLEVDYSRVALELPQNSSRTDGGARNCCEIAMAASEDFSRVFVRFRTKGYGPLYRG